MAGRITSFKQIRSALSLSKSRHKQTESANNAAIIDLVV
jgi:hypothetical protein